MGKTTKHAASHGGAWDLSDGGFVEISEFETGVPPEFRFCSFDHAEQPFRLLGNLPRVETIRSA